MDNLKDLKQLNDYASLYGVVFDASAMSYFKPYRCSFVGKHGAHICFPNGFSANIFIEDSKLMIQAFDSYDRRCSINGSLHPITCDDERELIEFLECVRNCRVQTAL